MQGAGAVAFEGEDVFGRPEDALDASADRRQVRAVSGLFIAAGRQDADLQLLAAGSLDAAISARADPSAMRPQQLHGVLT